MLDCPTISDPHLVTWMKWWPECSLRREREFPPGINNHLWGEYLDCVTNLFPTNFFTFYFNDSSMILAYYHYYLGIAKE